MKEKPILFSSAMVRAILEGRKSQTRRVMKNDWQMLPLENADYQREAIAKAPYQPGDILWVREPHWRYGRWRRNGNTALGRQRWRFIATESAHADPSHAVQFEAPDQVPARDEIGWHKRPSLFLPRKLSRITLEVTDVRVQRLQDISEEDARAEGMESITPYDQYRALWDSINAKRGHGWALNPFCWAISFRRIA